MVNHDFGASWTITNNYMHDNDGAAVFGGNERHRGVQLLRSQRPVRVPGWRRPTVDCSITTRSPATTPTNWEANAGLWLHGRREVLGSVNGATVTNNYVHDNLSVGLWADTNNRGFDISSNYISDNTGEGDPVRDELQLPRSRTTRSIGNDWVQGPTNPGFPTGAIYISESGGDSRVGATFATFDGREQRVHRQLGWRDPVGERRPVLRLGADSDHGTARS